MRWSDLRQSGNVEDRRGIGGGLAIGGGGIGILVLALVIWLCGGDPSQLLQNLPSQSEAPVPSTASNKATGTEDENRRFVGAVMGSLEDAWKQKLPQQARARYQDPKLVLFTGQIQSACGYASAASGPFYCPGDQKLYLDFQFFDELKREFRSPGDGTRSPCPTLLDG